MQKENLLQRKNRNSNIELLRIFAMLCIVLHHFSYHTDWDFTPSTFKYKLVVSMLIAFGKVGVGLFFLITGYFLASSTKNFVTKQKMLRLGYPVWFYSTGFFVLFLILGKTDFTIQNIGLNLLPFTHQTYWFASIYAIVLLFCPYLKIMLDNLDNKKLLYLAVGGILVQNVPDFIGLVTHNGEQYYLNNFCIGVLYVILGYSIFRFKDRLNTKKYILTGLIFSFIILFFNHLSKNAFNFLFFTDTFSRPYFWETDSIFTIVFCFCVFCLFLRLNIQSKFVNYLGGLMFGVYLIHENFLLVPVLWNEILKTSQLVNYPLPIFCIYSIVIVLCVFIICALIEAVRQFVAKCVKNWCGLVQRKKHIGEKNNQSVS